MQVEAHITDKGINLADVPALVTVLVMGFGAPDGVATAE
jgi:riboflavin transporter FmnP